MLEWRAMSSLELICEAIRTEIAGLRISGEAFTPDDTDYNARDSAMTRIYCGI
jgi:hypothetical protein